MSLVSLSEMLPCFDFVTAIGTLASIAIVVLVCRKYFASSKSKSLEQSIPLSVNYRML
jgi:hypothetical protein